MLNPVVIGYGSPIREDDAMGWQAAELLQLALPPHTATVIEDHQLSPELTAAIKDAPLVIFLDAAMDLAPGAIRLQSVRPSSVQNGSHHLLPGQLLQLAEQVNGAAPRAFLITGGIQSVGLSEEMTSLGEDCAARMAELAGRLVRSANEPAGTLPPQSD